MSIITHFFCCNLFNFTLTIYRKKVLKQYIDVLNETLLNLLFPCLEYVN